MIARDAGAQDAVASAARSAGLDASMRESELEEMTRSETLEIGVRVIVDQRQACVSGSIATPDTLREMSERAIAMAAQPDALIEMATEIDTAMHAVQGVDKTDTSSAGWRGVESAIAMSNGFEHARQGSFWSAAGVAIAGKDLGMERDYAYEATRWREDLPSLAEIGRKAGERAVRRLNPRKIETQNDIPVLLDQRVASSMLGHLIQAIKGTSVARGSTYLKDKLGEQIFGTGIKVSDNPLKPRGIASRPVDGDGLSPAEIALIEDGILKSWLLDLASARQLGLESNARASFGIGSVPRPSSSNVTFHPGTRSPEQMIASIDRGLLVTEFIGASINSNTGDYSRGASGHWIENGEIAYPVTEATVVGNLMEMFMAIEPANDLPDHRSMAAPSLLIPGCTVAGN